MKKYSKEQWGQQSQSKVLKSALIFRKLSESIKAYTEPQINKALINVQDQIQEQTTRYMKGNLKQLKRLLTQKKSMIKMRKTICMEENIFPKMEPSITQQIKRSSHAIKRSLVIKQSSSTPPPFYQNNFTKNTKRFQRKSKFQRNSTNQKLRINRLSSNEQNTKQNSKTVGKNKAALKQLVKQFCSNPKSITPQHFQTYYNVKKNYINALVSQPSYDYFKRLNDQSMDNRSRYQTKKISELEREGTQIQHYLNQCSQVLEHHYIHLDKLEEAKDIKNHREGKKRMRNTFNHDVEKRSKSKLRFCELKKIIQRRTCQSFVQNSVMI